MNYEFDKEEIYILMMMVKTEVGELEKLLKVIDKNNKIVE